MIDLKAAQFKSLTDPIYLGGHKIDEIWKGNVKIYPEIGIFEVAYPCVESCDGCIHIFGGYNVIHEDNHWSIDYSNPSFQHIKWDGTSWTRVGKIPGVIRNEHSTVHNGCIYAIFNTYEVYKYDGHVWSLVSDKNDLPLAPSGYGLSQDSVYPKTIFSLNGSLYAFSQYMSEESAFLKWNGSKWIWVKYMQSIHASPLIWTYPDDVAYSICWNGVVHLFYEFGFQASIDAHHLTWDGEGETLDYYPSIKNMIWFIRNMYFMAKDAIYKLDTSRISRLNSDGAWDHVMSVLFNFKPEDPQHIPLPHPWAYGTIYNGTFHMFNPRGQHSVYSQEEDGWIYLPDIIV